MLFPKDNFLHENKKLTEYLYEKFYQKIFEEGVTIKLKKNQELFHQGVFPSGVYIVKTGILKVFTLDRNGKEYIFCLVKSKNIIGFSTLMSGNNYLYSVSTITDCEIIAINKDFFLSLFDLNPCVLKKMNSNLINGLNTFTHNAHIIANYSVRERTALSLVNLHSFFKDLTEGVIDLSRKNHSNLVGTSVESLVRVLHDLKEEGLIEIEKSKIKILNYNQLLKVTNYF